MKKYCRKSGQIYLILIVILQGKKYNKSIGKRVRKSGKNRRKTERRRKNMQLFYTPQHARVGDVIPYYEDGKFHLFYLKNWNPYFGSDRKDGWHLLNTKDMVHYGPETAIGILEERDLSSRQMGFTIYITASLNRIRSGSTSATRRAVIWTVGRNTKKKHSDRTKRSICRPTGAIHTCSGMRKKTAGGCCCARRAREKQAAAAV